MHVNLKLNGVLLYLLQFKEKTKKEKKTCAFCDTFILLVDYYYGLFSLYDIFVGNYFTFCVIYYGKNT